jgi:hypothetical protein
MSGNDTSSDHKEIFQKILGWLGEKRFTIEESNTSNNDSDIEHRARAYLINKKDLQDKGRGLNITFRRSLSDSFLIHQSIGFTKLDKQAFLKLPKRQQGQYFMDMKKLFYPLHLNCEMKFPIMSIHKLIFVDSLNKQYFFDSVFDLLHALELANIRYDELRYSLFSS